jgi:hypothetical protein
MPQTKQQQKAAQLVAAQPREKAPEPTPKPEPIETPDWVNETPDDVEYSMMMYDVGGQCEQEIHMTREEFIRLKRWLAALRVYDLRSPMDRFTAGHVRGKSESEQTAQVLEISQEEIEMVMDLERVSDALVLNIRRRLRLGAAVEPGKWRLFEPADDTIESYE